jgi:hypothetical protein
LRIITQFFLFDGAIRKTDARGSSPAVCFTLRVCPGRALSPWAVLRAVGHWPVQFPHFIQYWTGAARTALLITNLFLKRKFLLMTNFIFQTT